jgi:tetratricopeptide (TPR) repeat protein
MIDILVIAQGIATGFIKSKITSLTKEFFKREFPDRLKAVFYQTVDEFEKYYKLPKNKKELAFYNFQDVLEPLLKYSFFKNFDPDKIQTAIQNNKIIIKPKEEELNKFLEIFKNKLKLDKELKKIELNEKGLEIIIEKVDEVKVVVDEIKENVKKILPQENKFPRQLTGIPHNLIQNVFGREKDLDDLQKLLDENNTVLVVNGLGGVGKSTLAQKYVQINQNNYDHLAYLEVPIEFDSDKPTDDNSTFLSAFVENAIMLERLNVNFEPKTPLEERFNFIIGRMQKIGENKKCLLVFDNVSKVLMDYSIELSYLTNWKILATSRQRMEDFEMMDLDVLELEDARELFYKHYQGEEDNTTLDQILEYIGRHTLTTELLAKTARRAKLKLKELFNNLEKEGIDFSIAEEVTTQHQVKSKGPTKPFEHLLQTFVLKLDEGCKKILRYFSILPSQFISYDELEDLFEIYAEEKSNFNKILNNLIDDGWITENNNTYRCHQIIQEVARRQLKPNEENCKVLINRISENLNFDYAKDNPVEKFKWIIFSKIIVKHFGFETKIVSILANNLGLRLEDQGFYFEAKNLLLKVLHSNIKNFGEHHALVGLSSSSLARAVKGLGKLKEAKYLFKKALLISIKNFGAGHQTVAETRSNLATVLRNLGELDEAKELLIKALHSDIKNFGENHPYVIRCRSNLATVLHDLGELNEARKLLQNVLQSDIKNFGEDHPFVARCRANLAIVLHDLGNLDDAKELHEKALQSYIKNYGENHPLVAMSRSNLANVLKDMGMLNKAKELLNKALYSDIDNFGEDHLDVARNKFNLSFYYRNSDELSKSFELLSDSYKICKNILGINHFRTKQVKKQLDHVSSLLSKQK